VQPEARPTETHDDERRQQVSRAKKAREPLVRQLLGARANLRRIRRQIGQYRFSVGVPQDLIRAERHLRTRTVELRHRLEGNERSDAVAAD
jgi:hypothetical protein